MFLILIIQVLSFFPSTFKVYLNVKVWRKSEERRNIPFLNNHYLSRKNKLEIKYDIDMKWFNYLLFIFYGYIFYNFHYFKIKKLFIFPISLQTPSSYIQNKGINLFEMHSTDVWCVLKIILKNKINFNSHNCSSENALIITRNHT